MTDLPTMSVVIPAYGPTPHLRAVLEALRAGTRQPETVYVSHSGSDDPTRWLANEFPEVRTLHSPRRLFAGAARNRAARRATTEAVAFCDSDTIPAVDWLEQAQQALAMHPGSFAVGSVGVAQTGGYWGMSTWLYEFSEQAPWRRGGSQRGGASCNMAVRTADLAAVGYFPEDFRAGQDTLLFHLLRTSGLQQIFQPAMRVDHFNISGFRHFARHLNNQGRHFAKLRKQADLSGSFAVRNWPLAPALGAFKALLVLRRMLGHGRIAMAAKYSVGIVAGSAIWSAGCCYAAATDRFTGHY